MNKTSNSGAVLSASIVTYNSEKDIRTVLNSIYESECDFSPDVYVVDNCSSDNTVNVVESEYPCCNLIRSKTNSGYGSGHNQAIRLVESEFHIIINPDIKFEPSLLQGAVDYMRSHGDVALMIPAVLDFEGKYKDVPRKNPRIRYLLGSYFSGKIKFFRKWRDEYYMAFTPKDGPFEIEMCSGSFMVFRTSALKSIDGFDERFFMYFEDCDISRRIKQTGKVICNPGLKVLHEGQMESHRSSRAFKMIFKSMCQYFNKWGWKF